VGDNIYINLVLDKSMTEAFLEDRKQPIENKYKYTNRNVSRLSLPDGFDLKTLPKNTSNQSKNFGYNITYEAHDSEIIVTKEFYVDYLVMEIEEFDEWNAIIADYAKACRKAIILSKN